MLQGATSAGLAGFLRAFLTSCASLHILADYCMRMWCLMAVCDGDSLFFLQPAVPSGSARFRGAALGTAFGAVAGAPVGMLQGKLDDFVRQERISQGLSADPYAQPPPRFAAQPEATPEERAVSPSATASAILNLENALRAIDTLQHQGGGAATVPGGKGWWGWATGWVPQSWRGGAPKGNSAAESSSVAGGAPRRRSSSGGDDNAR